MAFADADVYTDDAKVVEMVFRAHSQSEDALKPLREVTWPRAYLYYNSVHDLSVFGDAVSAYPYESSVFYPTVVQMVETIVPRLALGLLANEPLFKAKPLLQEGEIGDRQQYENWARRNEILLHNQLVVSVKARDHLAGWLRDSVLYGTKWLFIEWFTRRGLDWRMQPKEGAEGSEWVYTKKKDQVLEDRIKITGMPIWNVFPDPRATCIADARYIQRLMHMDVDTLWQWIEGTRKLGRKWKIKSKAELDVVKGTVRGEDDWHKAMQTAVGKLSSDQGKGWRPKYEDKRLVRVIDHWEADWHIIVAGVKGTARHTGQSSTPSSDAQAALLLLVERNPFKKLGVPFLTIRPTKIDGELFGVGLVDKTGQLVEMVNTMANLRITDLVRAIAGITLVDNLSGLTAEQLHSQVGAIFNVDGMVDITKSVHRIDWATKSQEQWREIDFAMGQMKTTSAATDFQSGQAQQGFNETARGIMALLQEGNIQFGLMQHECGRDLANMGYAMHKCNQQYITKARLVRTIGKDGADEWVTIDPEMIARDIDLEFVADPGSANRAMQVQQLINTAQIFGEWPELERKELIKELFKLSGHARPERFLAQQKKDADFENDKFRATGKMSPADPDDNHQYHIEVHNALVHDGTIESKQPHEVQSLMDHVQDHAQYGGMYNLGPQGQQGQQQPQGAPPQGVPPGGGGGGAPAPQPGGGAAGPAVGGQGGGALGPLPPLEGGGGGPPVVGGPGIGQQ